MIERVAGFDHGVWDVACDTCAVGCDTVEATNFYGAVAAIKELGWSIERHAGAWQHACPDCVAERGEADLFQDGVRASA